MSTAPQEINTKPLPQPKPQERGNIPRDVEIESIKRTLHNALDKLDRLKSREK